MLQQDPSGLGEGDTPPIARQQRLVQFDLELPHVATQQGLRHLQDRRSSGEAAEFSHANKRFQLLEIHENPQYIE